MTKFKPGDRVEVIHDYEGDTGSTYIGKRGSIYRISATGVEVELDDDDGIEIFDPEELRIYTKSGFPFTRDEWEHQISQYESEIDRLNGLLDEIQVFLPPGFSEKIAPNLIQEVLDKREGHA